MQVLLTVGNELMGDDAAGPLLAQMMDQDPPGGWQVVDGGAAPENYVHQVRALKPERVLLVDTADMGLEPGDVRTVSSDLIADRLFVTTHNMPLTFLIQMLEAFVPAVEMLGIQPGLVAFGYPMSPAVRGAVERIYRELKSTGQVTAPPV